MRVVYLTVLALLVVSAYSATFGSFVKLPVAARGGKHWGSDVAVWDDFAVATSFGASDHASLMHRDVNGNWNFFKAIPGFFTWAAFDKDYFALATVQNEVHVYYRHQGGTDQWGQQAVLDAEATATSLDLQDTELVVGRNDQVRVYRRVGDTQWAIAQTIVGITGNAQVHITTSGHLVIGDPAFNAAAGRGLFYTAGPVGQFINPQTISPGGAAAGDQFGHRVSSYDDVPILSPFVAKQVATNIAGTPATLGSNAGQESFAPLYRLIIGASPAPVSGTGQLTLFSATGVTTMNAPAPANVGSSFGQAIDTDFHQVIIGAPGSNADGEDVGAVYVLTLNGVGYSSDPVVPFRSTSLTNLGTLAMGEISPLRVFEVGTQDLGVLSATVNPDAAGLVHFVIDNPEDFPIRIQHGSDVVKQIKLRFNPQRPGLVGNTLTVVTTDPERRTVTYNLRATLAAGSPRRVIDPSDTSQLEVVWDFDQDGVFGEVGEDARNGDEVGQNAVYVTELPANTVTHTIHYKFRRTDTGDDYALQTTTITVRGYLDPRSTARISACTPQNSPATGTTHFLGDPFSPFCCSGRANQNTLMIRSPSTQVPLPTTAIMYRDAPYMLDLNRDVALEISAWIQSENVVKRPGTVPITSNAASLSFFLTPTQPTSPSRTNGAGGIQGLPGAVGIVFNWEDLQTVKVRFANQNGFVPIEETPASTNIRFWDRLRHLVVIRFETAPTNYLEKTTTLWVDGVLVGRFKFDLVAQLGGAQQHYVLYGGWAAHEGDEIGQTISVTYAYDACKFST